MWSAFLPKVVSTSWTVITGRMRRTLASVTPVCHTRGSVSRKATSTRNRATPPTYTIRFIVPSGSRQSPAAQGTQAIPEGGVRLVPFGRGGTPGFVGGDCHRSQLPQQGSRNGRRPPAGNL